MRENSFVITCVLNEHVEELQNFALVALQQGAPLQNVIMHLISKYNLSDDLVQCFMEDAMSKQRMKSLTSQEVAAIINAYNKTLIDLI